MPRRIWAQGFARPPQSARPWVYWFPLDGNLSREGITADLEAMQRVGIGGVLYMETAQGTPTGPVALRPTGMAGDDSPRLCRGPPARVENQHE